MNTTMDDVKPGDKIKFAEDAQHVHIVKRTQYHSWEHSLRIVETSQDKSITVPANSPVFPVEMIRPFSYTCAGNCGDTVEILFDIVRGKPPRSVQCGDCDDAEES